MANWRSIVGRRVPGATGIDGDVLSATPGWLWPYWLERQLDPESPAFVPRGPVPFVANLTARNWTIVGNLASPSVATVDPRGLVTPWVGGWSLDWWIGAEDRWHLPSREPAVRQTLVGATPVVETVMRIPGGDAVQRVYAVPASVSDGLGELVVVEVENQSAVPVAVAFAVRPYNPVGLAAVGQIVQEGATVLVDGSPGIAAAATPGRRGRFGPGRRRLRPSGHERARRRRGRRRRGPRRPDPGGVRVPAAASEPPSGWRCP